MEGVLLSSELINAQTLMARLPTLVRVAVLAPTFHPIWLAAAISRHVALAAWRIVVLFMDGGEDDMDDIAWESASATALYVFASAVQ